MRAEGVPVLRHLLPLDLVAHVPDEEAGVGISRDDGGTRRAAFEERLPGVQTQFALAEGSVARIAALGQHRPHPRLEERLPGLCGGGHRERGERRSENHREGAQENEPAAAVAIHGAAGGSRAPPGEGRQRDGQEARWLGCSGRALGSRHPVSPCHQWLHGGCGRIGPPRRNRQPDPVVHEKRPIPSPAAPGRSTAIGTGCRNTLPDRPLDGAGGAGVLRARPPTNKINRSRMIRYM